MLTVGLLQGFLFIALGVTDTLLAVFFSESIIFCAWRGIRFTGSGQEQIRAADRGGDEHENCRMFPEKDAVCEGSRRLSCGELWIFSARVYAYLHRKHIDPGDVVLVRTENTTDALIACIGVLRADAAFVIAGQNQDSQSVRYIESDCGCKVRIDGESLFQMLSGKGKKGLRQWMNTNRPVSFTPPAPHKDQRA